MPNDYKLFNFVLWIFAGIAILVITTSCSPLVKYNQIATATGTSAPLSSPTTKATPSAPLVTCTVTTGIDRGVLNLRTGAGVTYAVIEVLNEGETLTIIQAGAWLKVETIRHDVGYINSRYCRRKD